MAWFSDEARDFPLLQNILNGYGAHTASYWMGTRYSFSEVRWQGHEGDHSATSSEEFTPPPPMPQCYVQAQLYLYGKNIQRFTHKYPRVPTKLYHSLSRSDIPRVQFITERCVQKFKAFRHDYRTALTNRSEASQEKLLFCWHWY